MIYLGNYKEIKINIIKGPELTNIEELKKAGISVNCIINIGDTAKINICTLQDVLNPAKRFWQTGFKSKMHNKEDEILRIADWFQNAEAKSDLINKFLLYWIGFNGLYGLFAVIENRQNNNDADKFKFLIDNLLGHKAERIINKNINSLDSLETYNIKSHTGKTNWSNKLRSERSVDNPDYSKILKRAFRCIYGIRKEVFHEAPRPSDINERVEASIPLLKDVCGVGIKEIVNW